MVAKSWLAKNRGVPELSLEEGWDLLEREAQRYLHVSAHDFIRMWRAGEFGDPDDRPEVWEVAMLLPFVGLDPWRDGQDATGSRREPA